MPPWFAPATWKGGDHGGRGVDLLASGGGVGGTGGGGGEDGTLNQPPPPACATAATKRSLKAISPAGQESERA